MWLCRTIASSPVSRPRLLTFVTTPAGRTPPSPPAYREEVERPVEPARPDREVALADRRDEPAVETVGQPERRVDAVPSEPQRPLVQAQLASVKDAEKLRADEDL